ncbi:MAG: CinA family protein, partial [Natronosporangium sp.]
MTSGAGELLARLAARRETLAVAESLTGGLLAAAFVEAPGA